MSFRALLKSEHCHNIPYDVHICGNTLYNTNPCKNLMGYFSLFGIYLLISLLSDRFSGGFCLITEFIMQIIFFIDVLHSFCTEATHGKKFWYCLHQRLNLMTLPCRGLFVPLTPRKPTAVLGLLKQLPICHIEG